jgi:hypothetical protein
MLLRRGGWHLVEEWTLFIWGSVREPQIRRG